MITSIEIAKILLDQRQRKVQGKFGFDSAIRGLGIKLKKAKKNVK